MPTAFPPDAVTQGIPMKKLIAVFAVSAAFVAPAVAQDAPAKEWTGEGAFNAGITQGNTKTSDLGAALKIKHAAGQWAQSGELAADYGKTNGVETKNRLFGAGQVDRIIDEKWSAYGRVSAEHDEFSGFENRYFIGVGAAYHAIASDTTDWVIQGGPGYKIDETRARTVPPATFIPAATEESIGAQLASQFKHKLNDKVSFSNDTDVLYSDTSTQVRNVIALTVDLMGNLQARASYDIRYETDPPAGFKSTDTSTRLSLVYKIN